MFLDKKTLVKIWLNPGLNLTSIEEQCPGHQMTIICLALFFSTGAHNSASASTTPILRLCNGVFTDQFILASFCGTFSCEKGSIGPVCVRIHRTIMTKRKSKWFENIRKAIFLFPVFVDVFVRLINQSKLLGK